MKIITDAGNVLEFEIMNYGRGQWAAHLMRVNGERAECIGDPSYSTERQARKAARQLAPRYQCVRGLGWCVP